MELSFCDNYARTGRYADAFWNHGLLDRPMICVTAPKRGRTLPTQGVFQNPRTGYLAGTTGDYGPIFDTFEAVADATWYGGEALPLFDINLGPDIFAGYLGAGLRCVPHSDTTWAEPAVADWEDFPIRLDESPEGYFAKTRRYIEYAVKRSQGRYLTAMMDLHGDLDALSALRGPEELCCDLMDDPELVLEKLEAVADLWPRVYEMIYETSHMAERGVMGWTPFWCRERFAVLQCDFIAMISPAMFRRFALPYIRREAAYLDHSIFHLDGPDALKHLDDLLAVPEIDCIQWVPGDGQPRTPEWMEVLQRIQKAGKAVQLHDWTPEELKTRLRELDPALVAINLAVPTQDEGEALLEWLTAHT